MTMLPQTSSVRNHSALVQGLTLRVAQKADSPSVDRLLRRCYPRLLKADYPPSVMVTAVPLIARANPALLASGRYYVIEREGQILAAGGWSLPQAQRGRARNDVAHLRHLATDPDYLRMGLGQRLVRYAMDEARTAGAQEMQCLSTRTAHRFYWTLGFQSGRELQVPLAPGITFPAIEMWRKLS